MKPLKKYSRKLKNAVWEYWLNVRTAGIDRERVHPDAVTYEAISYPAANAILDALDLQPDDVFVDIGCGKGRMVCCAARRNIRKVIGVEINPRLSRMAIENARRLRGKKAEIDIMEASAEEADLSEATVFFLFNPFGPSTLRRVAERIEASNAGRLRPPRIVYALPKHSAVLESSGWLHGYRFWPPRSDIEMDWPISFWRAA